MSQTTCEYCGMPAHKYLIDTVESEFEAAFLGYWNVYEIRCLNPLCRGSYIVYE